MGSDHWWSIYYVVKLTFFCPHCESGLDSSGQVNRLVCLACHCIFEVRVELIEIFRGTNGSNLRKLNSAKPVDPTDGSSASDSSDNLDGSVLLGETDVFSK